MVGQPSRTRTQAGETHLVWSDSRFAFFQSTPQPGPGSVATPVTWIAEALRMGDPKRAASLVPSDPDPQCGREWKKAKGLLAEITNDVD